MDVALHDDAAARVAQGQERGVVPLRGAADEEPGAGSSPRVGGELLGLLEGVGIGRPDVDALDERRQVHVERLLPERLDHRRVCANAALVPRNRQPRRLARGVLAQGVDVGNPVLLHARNASED